MLERIEFTDAARWGGAIDAALAAHPQALPGARGAGAAAPTLAPHLARMAARMLADVMATRLPDGIVLGAIPAAKRLAELEFSLPAPSVSALTLNAVLKRDGYDVPRLAFRDLEGYLKGYIDLVFEHDGRYYVLDWKSNHLGYAASDYGPAALAEAMAEHGYHLQYLLYSLALERYLRHRLPDYDRDRHFGGVLYLFVRGVRPDWRNDDGSATGIYFHRPAAATLARLEALFAPAPEEVTS
jgi:exodeoxyribonuclease V beta subunit